MGAPGTTPGPWSAEVAVNDAGFETGKLWIVMRGEPCGYDFDSAKDAQQAAASPDLYDALEALERTVVELYREAFPGGNYGANALGSDGNKNTFADQNYTICAARAALAKARGEA